MDTVRPQISQRVIAFVDILGFSSLVGAIESDDSLHAEVYRALNRIGYVRRGWQAASRTRNKLAVSVFSDSIAISGEINDAISVILTCGWLQSDLLYLGILIRGGITIGPLVHDDEVVYGSGMVEAYNLEAKVAYYPRIIVSSTVQVHLPPLFKDRMLTTEADGICFIEPFSFESGADGADELQADGYDPREIYFRETIDRLEATQKRASRPEQIAKSEWALARCKKAAASYLGPRFHQKP